MKDTTCCYKCCHSEVIKSVNVLQVPTEMIQLLYMHIRPEGLALELGVHQVQP